MNRHQPTYVIHHFNRRTHVTMRTLSYCNEREVVVSNLISKYGKPKLTHENQAVVVLLARKWLITVVDILT